MKKKWVKVVTAYENYKGEVLKFSRVLSEREKSALSGRESTQKEEVRHIKNKTKNGEIFHSIGYLALRLSRKPQTIRKWEKSGCFPRPKLDKVGRRMYSEKQVTALVELCKNKEIAIGKPMQKWNIMKEAKKILHQEK